MNDTNNINTTEAVTAQEVGVALVELFNVDKGGEVVEQYYHQDIVSEEPFEGEGGRVEGMDALLAKHETWFASHEIHSDRAEGPYMGRNAEEFIVKFNMDVTPKGSERVQLEELGVYTVRDGKIVHEAFYYAAE